MLLLLPAVATIMLLAVRSTGASQLFVGSQITTLRAGFVSFNIDFDNRPRQLQAGFYTVNFSDARLVAAAAPLPSATEAPTGYSARRARRPSVGGRPASAPLRRDHDTRNAVAEPEREVEREARGLHDVELDCKLDFGAFLGALSVEYGGRTAR